MPLDITELLQPIPGDAPGGVSLRYEPIYDQIRRARTEEEDLPAGEWQRERKTADYVAVIKLSREALTTRSKDLQIAAWLTEALLKREGFAGLREGVDLIRGMLETFWDDLYPELEDDDLELRAAPLAWVGEYLDRAVRLVPITTEGHTIADYRDSRLVGYETDATTYEAKDQRNAAIAAGRLTAEEVDAAFSSTSKSWYKQLVADIDATLESVPALERVSDEKFGRDAPRFSPLVDAIREVRQVAVQLLERKLETDPDPVQVEEPPPIEVPGVDTGSAEGNGSGAPTIAVPGVFAAPAGLTGASGGAPGTRAGVEAEIAASARFLRRESATNPAPYLLLRGFRWGELRAGRDGLDPHLLVAPPTDVRTQLKTLLMKGRYAELLETAEEVMATPYGRGWLDLQRYVVSATEGLGEDYHSVGAAVRGALRSLLSDLPELASTTLADDTPTANRETQAWLRSEGLLDAVDVDAIDIPVRTSGPRQDVHARALQLAAAGKPDQAVDLLMREAAQEQSARGRFLRRTQAAAILVEAGMATVALPILEEISDTIDEHKLEEWEDAATVARPLGLLYRCHVAIDGDGSGVHNLFLRVCRLDPMLAMQFGPASPG